MSYFLIKCNRKFTELQKGINNMGKFSIIVGEDGTFAVKISKETIDVSFSFKNLN
jgi:hypothetical protein